MGFLKKAKDWFLGMDNPLGDKNLGTPKTHGVETATHGRLGSVMSGKGVQKTLPEKPIHIKEEEPQKGKEPDKIPGKNKKNGLTFDVLDLSRVIDIYAESRAVEAFDALMGKERKGVFQKVAGFFARSFQRMGRDAWIDTEKRKIVQNVKEGLKNRTYTEEFLREHVTSGDRGIKEESYLKHEEVKAGEELPPLVQQAINTWISLAPGSTMREASIKVLKSTLEASYPTITVDLSQLEASLIRLEKAKISSEVDTLEAKLNILDIGRIEQGNGKRKEGWFVKMADSISSNINKSVLPDWAKQKLAGFIRHPNTAAVISALATRAGVGVVAGAALATGFAGGFLTPILVGSTAGGFFASVRARREMRDRTAEIDRRGARGLKTGSQQTDGESSNTSHETNKWQHPAMDLYNRVARGRDGSPEAKEDALIAGLYYLVKHLVGRENGINMIQYDADKSISRQHVEMIRLMNSVFPGLVASFNDGSLLSTENNDPVAQKARELYAEIKTLAEKTMNNRLSEEGKYARKEGAKFGLTAAAIGGSVGLAVHEFLAWNNGSGSPAGTTGGISSGPKMYSSVHRGFWYDNGTPAPKFDHTELMIHTDKGGSWNVHSMLGKAASTLHHGNHTVTASDFTSGKIQAVITPKSGGPSFVLPINAQGNIVIPAHLQDAFNKKSFAFLEVGEVKIATNGQLNLNPVATVVGKGGMNVNPPIAPLGNRGDAPWYGVPVGGNKYHELRKTEALAPVGRFVEYTPPEDKDTSPIPLPLPPKPPVDSDETPSNTPDPTGLWEEDGGEDEKTDESITQEKLNNLWEEIVKVRQNLEARRTGDRALEETAIANLERTEKELLDEYHSQKRAWNKKQEDTDKTPIQLDETMDYMGRIGALIQDGVLQVKDGKPMIYRWYGRTIVAIKTKNGGTIPFYRSTLGTSGKTVGKWYPCFGISTDDSWLIKGSLNGMSIGHGIDELKHVQSLLNETLNWDLSLDSDFLWNAKKNPLVQYGTHIGDEFLDEEEAKQVASKPRSHNDGLADAWILEWLKRVTEQGKPPLRADSPVPTEEVRQTAETPMDRTERELTRVRAYLEDAERSNWERVTRGLSDYSPIENSGDEIITTGLMPEGMKQEDFVLKDIQHIRAASDLFNDVTKLTSTNALKATRAFYEKNGKLWFSDKTRIGKATIRLKSGDPTGNIILGRQVNTIAGTSLSGRLYEISHVHRMPEPLTIVFFHELGHQITMSHRVEKDSPAMRQLLREVSELRDEQSAGITPLSSIPFYSERHRQNPEYSIQFWEDMAELMGLYLMGREYVVRYLDDRITTRRSMKANISEGLRDKIMSVLDTAFEHYVS